jgi:hypothetical protein
MANANFEGIADILGSGNFLTDDYRAILIRTAGGGAGPYYTFSKIHDFMDDIPNNSDCRPASAVALTGKSLANGKLDAANTNFGVIAEGETIQAILIFKNVTNDADSVPVFWIDGLAIVPDGSTIEINWNDTDGIENFAP